MKLLNAVLVSLFLGTAGCGNLFDDDDDDDNNNSNAGVESPAGEVDGNPYRLALSRLIAGRYTGTCESEPEGERIESGITISTAGQIQAQGVTGSLLDDDTNLVFEREIEASGATELSYSAVDASSSSGLYMTLEAGPQLADNEMKVTRGARDGDGVSCDNVAALQGLLPKTLFSALSSQLQRRELGLRCIVGNQIRTLDLAITEKEIRVGSESIIPATGIEKETASVLTQDQLIYLVETSDNRRFGINLNAKGELDLLNYIDSTGDEYNCAP